MALVALKKHSAGPPPFLGVFVNRAFSLVPLGAGPQAGLSRRPYFVSRGAMARQLEALQAYSERRIARNRCRVPQDSRAPQQAAAPQLPHQPGVQPQPPAALADPAPPLVAPQPAKGGARRSRNCFASDYTPPAGDAPQGAAFALRVRQRPYGALPVWRLPKPGAPHRPAPPLLAPQPRPAAKRRPAPPPPGPVPAPPAPAEEAKLTRTHTHKQHTHTHTTHNTTHAQHNTTQHTRHTHTQTQSSLSRPHPPFK